MVKTARYQIIPIESDSFKFSDIYKVLWDLQRETMQVSNRTVQLCWEFAGYERDYKKVFDIYPNAKAREKVLGYKALNSYIYSELSSEFKRLNTANLSTTMKDVYDKFKREKLDYLKGEISIPNYKKTIPVDVAGRNIFLELDDKNNKWGVTLSLLSNSFKKELGLNSGRVSFKLVVKSGSQRSILENCLSGEYKTCASKLFYDKSKWFLNLSYGFENKSLDTNYDDSLVMGIYIGKFNAVCCAFNNNDRFLRLEGGDIEVYRERIEARRRSLLKQSKECGDGRKGHGYHTRVKPIYSLSKKISNYRNTINHRYSKVIIEFAKKNCCGTIYMEDLKNISKNDRFLKNWSYHDLQGKIIYKAKQYGIVTHVVTTKVSDDVCSEEDNDRKIAKALSLETI